jgi:polyribonucleotide nucleotidyltransferase
MASACASSLSLMDAGVPISSAVAGISLGLVTDDNDNYAILTDIEGLEDNYGDMDYKVAGTREGITAIQLDTKLRGISLEILEKALYQGRQARLSILDVMHQTIGSSRPEISRHAPRMHKITIDPDKIGAVIGSGGKTIRSIIEETKTTIDISNDGSVMIGAVDAEAADKAIKIIEDLTKDVEVGAIYTGKVVRLMTFGAFVEILPGKDGMVHISELADYRVERVDDIVKVGDEVTVKVIGIDSQGRVNLSRRASSENLSQPSGAQAKDSLSADPQGSRPPISKRRH